jgi:hypothetical protein
MSMFRNNCLESVHQTAVKVQDDAGDSCIWICFDAKTDVTGRYNANLIVVKQDKYKYGKVHLSYRRQLAYQCLKFTFSFNTGL